MVAPFRPGREAWARQFKFETSPEDAKARGDLPNWPVH